MPIDNLPNEILQLIFRRLVTSPTPFLATPPCRIAEVCHLWYSQALLVPEIFGILPLISLTSGNTTRMVPRRLLSDADGPLSFALDGVRRLHKDNPNLRRMFKSSATWEHAELLGLEPRFSMAPLDNLSRGFPRLHTLKLQISNTTRDVYVGHINVFEHAHSLRHLELECSGALRFKAPYGQLLEYVERSSTAIAIRSVLSPESQLQSLSFESLHPVPLPCNVNLPMMEVTRLTSLNLYLQPETVTVLLCRLTLPSLTRLRVVSSSPSALSDVTALVSRSGCPLETLSLRILEVGMYWNLIASNTEMVSHVPLLDLCPRLRKLELDRLDPPTLQNILQPPSPTFLPHLREFIAHLPSAPRGRFEGVAAHGGVASTRRVPFVRLIFRSAEDRAVAHLRMEGAIISTNEPLALDPRLMDITRFLSSSNLSQLRTGRWWRRTLSVSNEPSMSSRLSQALSYLETNCGSVHGPWQILVGHTVFTVAQLLTYQTR